MINLKIRDNFFFKKSFNIKNPKRNKKDKIKTKTNIKIKLQDLTILNRMGIDS